MLCPDRLGDHLLQHRTHDQLRTVLGDRRLHRGGGVATATVTRCPSAVTATQAHWLRLLCADTRNNTRSDLAGPPDGACSSRRPPCPRGSDCPPRSSTRHRCITLAITCPRGRCSCTPMVIQGRGPHCEETHTARRSGHRSRPAARSRDRPSREVRSARSRSMSEGAVACSTPCWPVTFSASASAPRRVDPPPIAWPSRAGGGALGSGRHASRWRRLAVPVPRRSARVPPGRLSPGRAGSRQTSGRNRRSLLPASLRQRLFEPRAQRPEILIDGVVEMPTRGRRMPLRGPSTRAGSPSTPTRRSFHACPEGA